MTNLLPTKRLKLLLTAILVACLAIPQVILAGESLVIPDVQTHNDGRQAIGELYHQYLSLQEQGWKLDIVYLSQPAGREVALPIIALRTAQEGSALWIFSGIHGEEPAGPNAIAESIADLAVLGKSMPIVLLPLNNPHGYANNWRYLNVPVYDETIDGQSVGDSSHLLLDPENRDQARAPAASSPEAVAITRYVVETGKAYPPVVSLDLHEDNLIDEGYVYSQGKLGERDPLATQAVQVLMANHIPLKLDGVTRFDEPINQGIIGPVVDGSIDELMSAASILLDGKIQPGPYADSVLVFETPAAAVALPQRVEAHAALLQQLGEEIASQIEAGLGSE